MNWDEIDYYRYCKKNNIKYDPPKNILEVKEEEKNKYNNQITIVDNIKFDSAAEANYYNQLLLLKRAGEIKEIKLQPKYLLIPGYIKNNKKIRAAYYIADFEVEYSSGDIEVIDVKGYKTQLYKFKKKLFEYKYTDLKIKEVNLDEI